MFDKIKQMKKMREVQNALAQEKIESEKNGTKVVLDGNLKVVEVVLNPSLSKEDQEKTLQECFNEGTDKVKMAMVQKFQGMM